MILVEEVRRLGPQPVGGTQEEVEAILGQEGDLGRTFNREVRRASQPSHGPIRHRRVPRQNILSD